MSLHELESLVEDSTYLIDKSRGRKRTKRNKLSNLYRFESMYDTSYTHFRCIDILLKYGMTYRIPLAQHPDFALHQAEFDQWIAQKQYWLPAEIAHPDEASVYYNEEDQMVYFDAGSAFWQRLSDLGQDFGEKPEQWAVGRTITEMMKLAVDAENSELFSQWLAVATFSLAIERDLDQEAFFKDKNVKSIRKLAQLHPGLIDEDAGYGITSFIPDDDDFIDEEDQARIDFIQGKRGKIEKTLSKKVNYDFNKIADDIAFPLVDSGFHLIENEIRYKRISQLYSLGHHILENTGNTPYLRALIDPTDDFIVFYLQLKYDLIKNWQDCSTEKEVLKMGMDTDFNLFGEEYLDPDHININKKGKKIKNFTMNNESHTYQMITYGALPGIRRAIAELAQKYDEKWFDDYCSTPPFLDISKDELQFGQSHFKKLPGKFAIRWHMILIKAFWHYEQGDLENADYWAKEFLKYIEPVQGLAVIPQYKLSAESILNRQPKLCKIE